MRVSWAWVVVFFGVVSGASSNAATVKGSGCQQRQAVLEGAVSSGEGYVGRIGNGLEVMLEPLASGWILRVLPDGGPRGKHDYAELATPPYRSVSPLLVSTDFSFRAQDVVAWNPRRFRYAASQADFRKISRAYEEFAQVSEPSGSIQEELAKLVSHEPEGRLEILDAHLVPGTANQSQMAGVVAVHLSTTPHTIEQAGGGTESVLGRVTWLRFRVRLDLPEGFHAFPGLATELHPCELQ